MQISTAFFLCLGICVFGVILALVNIFFVFKRFDLSKGNIAAHLFAGACYVLGGIGAIVTGIVWALQYLKH